MTVPEFSASSPSLRPILVSGESVNVLPLLASRFWC